MNLSIGVVTDSTSDIPAELAGRLNIHIVPNIVTIEGHSLEDGKDISRQEFYERLQQFLLGLGPLERLAMLYTNAEAEARQLTAGLDIQLPSPPLFVNVTTVIGTHVGPNGLGFAAVIK